VTRPTVTVVIPVRDGAGHVGRALASVVAQTVPPDAVAVVDDGSRDATVAVASRFGPPVTVVSTPPRGAAAARNRGIRDATTDTIAFLDADDTWPSDRLERHLAILAARDDAAVVLGATRYIGLSPAERARYRFPGPETTAVVMHLGAATVRRSVFRANGLLDESLRRYEDWDWFIRIRELGVVIHVDGAVANQYRRRPGSTSQVSRPGDPTVHQVLKRSLDRRRAGGAAPGPIGPMSSIPPASAPEACR
jgi:glycosyltransferase involved in cell wall biosynthesis